MMFWLARILAAIIMLIVLVYGVGLLMPVERPVTKTTSIDAVPQMVYEILTDVEKYPAWRSDLRQLTIDERGALWRWTEVLQNGATVRVRETEKLPDQRFALEYENSSGVHGRWVAVLEPSGETRTRLTCTDTVVIENPLIRLPAYVLMNVGARLDMYFGDLGRRIDDLSPDEVQGPVLLP